MKNKYFYQISEAKIVRYFAINASKTEAIQLILSTRK